MENLRAFLWLFGKQPKKGECAVKHESVLLMDVLVMVRRPSHTLWLPATQSFDGFASAGCTQTVQKGSLHIMDHFGSLTRVHDNGLSYTEFEGLSSCTQIVQEGTLPIMGHFGT